MPKKTIDYQKCIIYKIQHKENEELLYIGHTTAFKNRKYQHKSSCYNLNGFKFKDKLYSMIRENGGWEMFKMLEIKKFPCNDFNEARAEEDRCMLELKACMNSRRAFRGVSQYQIDNKEVLKEKSKEYRLKNKEQLIEKSKIYRNKNKDELLLKAKEYYLKLKNDKVSCPYCNSTIIKLNIKNHQKTKKCLELREINEQIQ